MRLDFLRRNYKVICADLSGNLERYSLELMQESKAVLLVCTPEVPSLHLAREKMAFLKSIDVKDRVSVVLNRVHKKPLFSPKQVEELLGVPVIQVGVDPLFSRYPTRGFRSDITIIGTPRRVVVALVAAMERAATRYRPFLGQHQGDRTWCAAAGADELSADAVPAL